MRTFAAFLLLSTLAFAEKPTANITGPTERNPGALTFLDAGASAGAESFAWMVDTSLVAVPKDGTPDVSETVEQLRQLGFEVQEPEDTGEVLYAISEDGKRLWLSSYPGTYSVVLGVANADGIALLPWKVTVKGKTPDPPKPGPQPEPTPEPLTGLSAKVSAAVKPLTAAHGELSEVADVYESVAAMAAAGALKSPDEVVEMTKTLTKAKLPTRLADWQGVVVGVIGPHLNALSESGKLETAQDHVEPWGEIAKGIRSGIN